MNTQFSTNVYNFTEELVKSLVANFDGKVVGSEDMDVQTIMKSFFDEYQPGDQVNEGGESKKVEKKVKKAKKVNAGGKPAPKRATTAFFYFTADIREQTKNDNPNLKMSDLAKIHGEKWKALSDAEREPYNKKNEVDKVRYEKEKAEWVASNMGE